MQRAKRLIENTFGITSARWRSLRRSILASTDSIEKNVKASTILYAEIRIILLYIPKKRQYLPSAFYDKETDGNLVPGKWRSKHTDKAWKKTTRVSSSLLKRGKRNQTEMISKNIS